MPSEREFGLRGQLADQEVERMRRNLDHWQTTAARFGTGHTASWGDAHAMSLEAENLVPNVPTGGRVLDAGCANGYTTFRALERRPSRVRAFDYSPLMIEQARAAAGSRDPMGMIDFYVGNVLEIAEPSGSIDMAYTVRVLINLPTWERQQQAIREIHRILRPGGRYLLSEAFTGSQAKLNELRRLAGLPPLTPPEFNLYLDESRLEAFLGGLFEVVTISRFSSLYYVGTRFVRDLTLQGGEGESYDSSLHRFFRELRVTAASGDFGIQKSYLLSRSA